MMKIAIIGYGWLGLPLAKSLKMDSYDVIGTSTSHDKVDQLNAEGLKTFQFSGEANENLKNELMDCDWIVLTIPPSKNCDYVNLLSEVVDVASPLCQVIFTSSIGVYKEVNTVIDEQGELIEDHSVVKAEKFLQDRLKDKLTILRLGGLIGNDRHPVKYLAGRKNIEGGQNPVNLIHLEDVIVAIKIIIKSTYLGEVFNLVSPEHPIKQEYYTISAERMNLEAPQFNDDERYGKLVSADRITSLTNFNYSNSIL